MRSTPAWPSVVTLREPSVREAVTTARTYASSSLRSSAVTQSMRRLGCSGSASDARLWAPTPLLEGFILPSPAYLPANICTLPRGAAEARQAATQSLHE